MSAPSQWKPSAVEQNGGEYTRSFRRMGPDYLHFAMTHTRPPQPLDILSEHGWELNGLFRTGTTFAEFISFANAIQRDPVLRVAGFRAIVCTDAEGANVEDAVVQIPLNATAYRNLRRILRRAHLPRAIVEQTVRSNTTQHVDAALQFGVPVAEQDFPHDMERHWSSAVASRQSMVGTLGRRLRAMPTSRNNERWMTLQGVTERIEVFRSVLIVMHTLTDELAGYDISERLDQWTQSAQHFVSDPEAWRLKVNATATETRARLAAAGDFPETDAQFAEAFDCFKLETGLELQLER